MAASASRAMAPWVAVDEAVVVMSAVQAGATAVGRAAGKVTAVAMEGMAKWEEVRAVVQAVGWEAHHPLAKSAAGSLAHSLEPCRHCNHHPSCSCRCTARSTGMHGSQDSPREVAMAHQVMAHLMIEHRLSHPFCHAAPALPMEHQAWPAAAAIDATAAAMAQKLHSLGVATAMPLQ